MELTAQACWYGRGARTGAGVLAKRATQRHDEGVSLDPVLIACDESGSEGENVTHAGHRVFVHASVAVGESESAEVMARVRRLAPSQAPEYKADQILRPMAAAAASWLLAADGPLAGRALVHLVDKDYFVVGKVVDLLVAEVAYAAGEDLYAGRRARGMALTRIHRLTW